MVQKVIEPFNIDIIKVTIKDKPNLCRFKNEESLKEVFDALRLNAQQERKIRELRVRIYERISQRRLRHYFDIWYNNYATMRKISEYTRAENKMSNEKKIELFINAIAKKQKEIEVDCRKEKCQKGSSEMKSAPQQSNKTQANKQIRAVSGGSKTKGFLATPAQNRLETQKMIIDEQRVKLAEQSKFIQDMKLNEISKEAKQTSVETIIIAKQVLNQCDQRTKRSLIHLMKEQGCRDESVIEAPRILSPPRFLIRMEERAEARKQRMKQANEVRQRRREEQKRKEAISRQEAEEKERQEQIQALKEAKRIRKEQEDRRLKELEKNKKLEFLAVQFYKKYLFRRYIVEPLFSLVQQRNQRLEWAYQHYEETLLLKVFSAWKSEWINVQNAKLQLARKLYRHNLLWYAFDDWRALALRMKQEYQVALDFYDMKLQRSCMKAWHSLCVEINVKIHEKEVKAIKHYENYLKRIHFNIWRKYVLIADDIEDREKRRDEWRKIIKKFVPHSAKQKNVSLNF